MQLKKIYGFKKAVKFGGFEAANEAIGTLVLKFDDEKDQNKF